MTMPLAGGTRWTAERRFYLGMALAMFATVVLGFARSFFLRPLFPGFPAPVEPIFYVHGTVYTTWLLLLILQPTLVASGRLDLHRAFGRGGAVLAAAMVVLGVTAAVVAARRPTGFIGIPVPPLQFLAIPLFDMVLFATFVSLAIAKRHDGQAHKRLMVLATTSLLAAGVSRWPFSFTSFGPPVYFGVSDLFIVALGTWDVATRRRLHPVTLWGGLALIVSQPLRLAVSGTAAWLSFAHWVTGVPG